MNRFESEKQRQQRLVIANRRVRREYDPRILSARGDIPKIQAFKIAQILDDVLECQTWDGETLGEDLIYVAKPWLLRRTPFDGETRDDISYVYSSNTERTATIVDTGETEEQVIVPRWKVIDSGDDVIFATRGHVGGLLLDEEDYGDVIWLDENRDGRFWAKKSE